MALLEKFHKIQIGALEAGEREREERFASHLTRQMKCVRINVDPSYGLRNLKSVKMKRTTVGKRGRRIHAFVNRSF